MSSDRGSGSGYWITVLVLVLIGFPTGFTIGGIFWFIAFVMILLGPLRSRPRLFRTGPPAE